MGTIRKINAQTKNRFLNMYELEVTKKTGSEGRYYVSSRAEDEKDLKLVTHENRADGVIIFGITPDLQKVLLVRQYRYPIDAYVYELPAGLIDAGETYRTAAVREVHEETGLMLEPLDVDPMYEEPRFTTVGMTDESCAMIYGYADDVLAEQHLEDSEEIEVLIADRDEVRRILKEEYVACNCALQLMHFLADEEPFAFLKKD